MVRPDSFTYLLHFTDGKWVEYSPSTLAVSDSRYITAQPDKSTHTGEKTKRIITMDCSHGVFDIIDKLATAGWTRAKWDRLNLVLDAIMLPKVLEKLVSYDYTTRTMEQISCNINFLLFPETRHCAKENAGSGTSFQLYKFALTAPPRLLRMLLKNYLRSIGLELRTDKDTIIIGGFSHGGCMLSPAYEHTFNKLTILRGTLGIGDHLLTDIEKEYLNGGILLLIGLISGLTSVPALDLSGCQITEASIGHLKHMNNLKTLILRNCLELQSPAHPEHTLPNNLECLDISENSISGSISKLLSVNTKLKRLIMENCSFDAAVGLDFLNDLTELEELTISNNKLSSHHLDIIYSHDNIKRLTMNGCVVDKKYLFEASTKNLKILMTGSHSASIKGPIVTIILSGLSQRNRESLAELYKYNGKFVFFNDECFMKPKRSIVMKGVEGAPVAKPDNDKVKPLDLSMFNGGIFWFSKERICIMLPNDVVLPRNFERDFCRGQKLCFVGSMRVDFLDNIKIDGFMSNVEELSCEWSNLSAKQAEMILARGGFKKLNMRGCGLDSRLILKFTEGKELEELNLEYNSLVDKFCFSHIITSFPNLKRLNLGNCKMQLPTDLTSIPKLETLTDLNIGGNFLSGGLRRYIFSHETLTKLNVAKCGITGDDLVDMKNLTKLKELYIGKNPLYEGSIDEIFMLPELEVLSIPNTSTHDEERQLDRTANISNISKLSKLTTIDISNNIMVAAFINEIFTITSLRALVMQGVKFNMREPVWNNISKLVNLTKLDLRCTKVTRALLSVIPNIKELSELDLLDVDIFECEYPYCKDDIKGLTKPKFRGDYCANRLGYNDFGFLLMAKKLQVLRINDYVDGGEIANMLRSLPDLKVLYLSRDISKPLSCYENYFYAFSSLESLVFVVEDACRDDTRRLSSYVELRREVVPSCPQDGL